MITVLAIDGSPSEVPASFISSHYDGTNFYFFETEEEDLAHKAKIESEASKEEVVSQPIDLTNLDLSLLPQPQLDLLVDMLKTKLGL